MKIYRGKAPNYRLKADFQELPKGSFICPVSIQHLPSHIKEESLFLFNPKADAACFTKKGFCIIPWDIIEEC